MISVVFISENVEQTDKLRSILTKNTYDFSVMSDEKIISEELISLNPEIVIIDQDYKSLKNITKTIKSIHNNAILIYLVSSGKVNKEASRLANALITSDMSEDLIISTINISFRMKNSLEMLSSSNKDLADSLYRLNTLYTTTSQFAGTLDNSELIRHMIEGMDKALSFSLNCALSVCDEPVLIINSLYELSDELISAIKLRTVLNYTSFFKDGQPPIDINTESLRVVKHVKYPANRFTFTLFQYDNLSAPIKLGDNFFGCVEIFKETPFTPDDTACFQTIAQQVALPLKSAVLYKELMETNQKLKELEHIKSEFVSIASHELRTPLASIKNSLDILQSGRCGEINSNFEKFLSMAARNVKTLSAIINDLLDLSKIEAGKMEFKFKPMNINTVIDCVKSAYSEFASSKGLTLLVEETNDLPEITADAQRLEQVLANLVSNAIKFTPEGKNVKISSCVINSEDIKINDYFKDRITNLSGDYVQVTVEDEGIGMRGEDMLRAFDKFAQIENTLSRKVGGTGLGLPIAKQLLDAHKGAIWCDSELNKGTKFYFIIPMDKVPVKV